MDELYEEQYDSELEYELQFWTLKEEDEISCSKEDEIEDTYDKMMRLGAGIFMKDD